MNPFDILDSSFNPPPEADSRVWSPYQHAIFQGIQDEGANLLIRARAGSGKTSTILKGMDYGSGSVIYLAFNKDIAGDIRQKAPSGEVKTFNALGHWMWYKNSRSSELDKYKLRPILRGMLSADDNKEHGYSLMRAIGLAKNNIFGILDPATSKQFRELFDNYDLGIPEDRYHDLSEIALRAFQISISKLETFDFDDQVYIPLAEGWTFPTYTTVFVDEAQDLSPINHLMIQRLHEKGARIIAVGDDRQAIYGFRGAMSNSLDRAKAKFEMLEFPLPISYRCSEAVIAEAQRICPDIQAREGASKGLVQYVEQDPEFFQNAMVLCRNNAPLFKAIMGQIRAKLPCQVRTNFLETFTGFLNSFKVETTKALAISLEAWFEKERSAAMEKGHLGKLAALQDKYDTTKVFIEDFAYVDDIIRFVKDLGNSRIGPVFATIHKSKGLEHSHVHLLRPDLLPSRYAQSKEALHQEANLEYVGITRAKETFTYGEMQ